MILIAGCPRTGEEPVSRQPSDGQLQKAVAVWADPALRVPLEVLGTDFSQLHPPGMDIRYIESGELIAMIADAPADPSAQSPEQSDQPLEPPAQPTEQPSQQSEQPASPPTPVTLSTPDALDLPAGQPDVYITAHPEVFTALRQAGAIDELSARTFAGDRLVVAHRSGERWKSATLFDVYKLRFSGFGVASLETALGYYSDQALISAGGKPRIEDRIRDYAGIEELLTALAEDEVQLVMIYASAVAQHDDLDVMLIVGEDLHEDIRYRAAAAADRSTDPAVAEFLRFLAEDAEAQQKLAGYGLLDRIGALEETR